MATFAATDGTRLSEKVWPAEGSAKASVVLVHGYGEHIERYEHVGRALAQAGFAVRGIDLRGHGQSGGRRGFCRRFGEFTGDLELVLERARQEASRPLFIVAHSFGGLITLRYLIDRPRAVDAFVLSSPWLRNNVPASPLKLLAGKVMSVVYPTLSLPSGLRGADVTRDPEIAAIYDRDPLNNKDANARWFTESTTAQEEVLQRACEITLPCLVMQAGADKISDPRRTEEVFKRLGSKDKTFELLEGQYHELFNELPELRAKNIATVVAWLSARLGAAAGARLQTGAP